MYLLSAHVYLQDPLKKNPSLTEKYFQNPFQIVTKILGLLSYYKPFCKTHYLIITSATATIMVNIDQHIVSITA